MISGKRLDDAGVGIGLHGGGESDDAGAGHQAVGIEHQHVVVGAAPAGHEIGDVAGLALEVLGAVPVIDPRQRPELVAQGDEGPLLGDPGIRVRGIGQDEIVEMRAEPGRLDGFADRLERREGAGRRLVVDRHDDRGARRQPVRDRRRAGGALDEHEEAEDGAREGESDPREVDREQAEQDPLQDGDGADRHDLIHLEGAVGRQGGRAAEHEQPREPRHRLPRRGREAAARRVSTSASATAPAWRAGFPAALPAPARRRSASPRSIGFKASNGRAMSRLKVFPRLRGRGASRKRSRCRDRARTRSAWSCALGRVRTRKAWIDPGLAVRIGFKSAMGPLPSMSPVKSTKKRRRRPLEPRPTRVAATLAKGGRSGGVQHQNCR